MRIKIEALDASFRIRFPYYLSTDSLAIGPELSDPESFSATTLSRGLNGNHKNPASMCL